MINALISGKQSIGQEGDSPKGKRALNRAKLLRTGAELLSQQSYASTGVDHIIAQAGLTKGTFYHYFKSKEQFACEVVDLYADYFNQKLDAYLLNDAVPPLERLSAYVDDSIRAMRRDRFKRTCLIGNLSQELGGQASVLVTTLKTGLSGWEKRLAACLSQAQASGEVADTADVNELATIFWMGWQGALMQARLFRCADPIELFFKAYLKLVKYQWQ